MSDKRRAEQATDAAVLARLAQSERTSVRNAVARNPSAPWEVLRDLLEGHAAAVIENPSLPLLLLADPGMFNNLHASALNGLASVHRRLGDLLGWTAEPPWTELQLTLICVERAGPLGNWGRRTWSLMHVRQYLAGQRSVPGDVQVHLSRDPVREVRIALAPRCTEPTAIEVLLAEPELHPALARNPNVPVCYLWAMASEGDARTRISLVRNNNTPAALLTQLARDPDPHVRMVVAESRNIPDGLRRELAWDPSSLVRGSARNEPRR